MSNTRLHVGGISDKVKREHLEDLFGKHGKCEQVWVALNPSGFAFVNFETEDAASDAVEALNGEEFMGCKLRVEVSSPRAPGGPGGRGGPKGGGGYGGLEDLGGCRGRGGGDGDPVVKPAVAETPRPFSAFSFLVNTAAEGSGFLDFATQNKSSPFQFAGSGCFNDFSKKLSTESPTLFGGKPKEAPQLAHSDQGDDGVVEDFVPTAEFAPVIPLPPLVEVKKGDEYYETVFEVRAELLRWEGTTREWKERGLGNIRLLQHRIEKRKARILMWRDQSHKIACNHSILKGMTVGLFQNNPKTLMWTAIDFTEGQEGKNEKFVCKFGKEEQCAEFRRHFEDLERQVEAGPAEGESESPKTEDSPVSGSISQVNNNQKPLAELFKKPKGAWTCSGCCMDNSKTNIKCPSCGTFMLGSEPDQSAQPTLFSTSIFGSSTTTPTFDFSFGTHATPQNDLGKDPVKETPSPFPALSFAATPATQGLGFGDLAGQNKSFNFRFAGSDGSPDNFKKLSTETPSIFRGKPKETSQSGDNDPADDGVVDDDDKEEEEEPLMYELVVQLSVRYPGSPEYLELGDGVIRLICDNKFYCYRFHFIGHNEQEISHVISADTHLLSIGDLTFAWSGLCESDEAKYMKLDFQGKFAESSHYDLFRDRLSDSQEIAAQEGITEEYLLKEEQQ